MHVVVVVGHVSCVFMFRHVVYFCGLLLHSFGRYSHPFVSWHVV